MVQPLPQMVQPRARTSAAFHTAGLACVDLAASVSGTRPGIGVAGVGDDCRRVGGSVESQGVGKPMKKLATLLCAVAVVAVASLAAQADEAKKPAAAPAAKQATAAEKTH